MEAMERRLVTDQVLARLTDGLGGVSVFDAELYDKLTGQTVAAPLITDAAGGVDPSGRVARYVVLYPSGGVRPGEVDLAETHLDLALTYQVSCVAGWRADCEQLVDDVDALLFRWAPSIDGIECGWLRPPTGFQPGPMRRTDDARPAPTRFWVPLQYQLRITR